MRNGTPVLSRRIYWDSSSKVLAQGFLYLQLLPGSTFCCASATSNSTMLLRGYFSYVLSRRPILEKGVDFAFQEK